jgi:hypothetical protein
MRWILTTVEDADLTLLEVGSYATIGLCIAICWILTS